MSPLRIHNKTCVLVCDGSKALFYINIGDAQAITLKTVGTLHEPHAATRDLGTDRPGRAVDAMGISRSSVQQTDLHAAAEAEFLKRVAETVADVVRDNGATSVVVVAPPRALGILRDQFGADVRQLVQAELAKDLVKMPTAKVEEYLQGEGVLR